MFTNFRRWINDGQPGSITEPSPISVLMEEIMDLG